MSNWLFLRGSWDERTQKSIDDDDDMWVQLFRKLGDPNYDIWFLDRKETLTWITCGGKNITKSSVEGLIKNINPDLDYIFARGGFDYYLPILKKCPNAYKIRYGAGKRFVPEPEIDYQLILVDTEKQKADVLAKYPKANVHLFIKPAARHFKPLDVEKEYDVCYIANGQQARFKGIEWIYKTCPSDISILHLGYPSKFKPPANVTCRRVDRIDMAREISRCKVGIVPYDSTDSCPRVIPEMLACGLPLVILDTVNFWKDKYCCVVSNRDNFWKNVINSVDVKKEYVELIKKYYKIYLSLPIAAKHIKELING